MKSRRLSRTLECCRFICLWLAGLTTASLIYADDWPQWRGVNRDGAWTETGIVEEFGSPQITPKWRVPIGSGYSGPTVMDGRVYVMDALKEPKEEERVHCFDCQTGEQIWSYRYEAPYDGIGYRAGPRASVLIEDGLAYSLGAAGHLNCFDAADGRLMWGRNLREQYKIRMPNWGIAASPLIEGDLLITQIGGTDACVLAFDRKSGEEIWRSLKDDAGYSAPMVIDQAGQRVVVVWTGNRIVGLNPNSGDLLWEFPFDWTKWPIGIATPVLQDDLLLFSEAHKGTLLLRLGTQPIGVERVWHRQESDTSDQPAMHCLMSTPIIQGDHIYGADINGVLRCLRLDTGQQVWEDRTAVPENRWANIHLIRAPERTWLFNERGELIIAKLTPDGFEEISRAQLIEPTTGQLRRRDGVTWTHPAFANGHIFIRNDEALICASLKANENEP